MANVRTDDDGVTHLCSSKDDRAICGKHLIDTHVEENMLTCAACAADVAIAIATTTKKERKEWRDL